MSRDTRGDARMSIGGHGGFVAVNDKNPSIDRGVLMGVDANNGVCHAERQGRTNLVVGLTGWWIMDAFGNRTKERSRNQCGHEGVDQSRRIG